MVLRVMVQILKFRLKKKEIIESILLIDVYKFWMTMSNPTSVVKRLTITSTG
jgi:hypothetical protein